MRRSPCSRTPDSPFARTRSSGIDLPDHPGGLANVLRIVAEAGVNIEYVYSLVSTFVVINVADVNRALHLLGDRPVRLVSQDDIAAIGR